MVAAIDSGTDRLGFYQSAFLSREHVPWHGLGNVFDKDRKITMAEALAESYLGGWDVRTRPIIVQDTDGTTLDPERYAADFQAVIRTNPFNGGADLLHVAGSRYEPFQNEAALTFADNLLDGGVIETLGSIQGGRKVFGSLRMRKGITLDPQGRKDHVRNYLLVTTSHDGTLPLTVINTPVRVVCQNTLSMALSGAKVRYAIRHTGTIGPKVEEARKVLAINLGYMDAFEREAQAMIQTELTTDAFNKIVKALYPEPTGESKAAATRYAKRVDLLNAIYTGTADGPDTQSKITGTVWGGLNALTEALDWYRSPRKGDAESVLSAASGLDAVAAQNKAKVFGAFRSLVKV